MTDNQRAHKATAKVYFRNGYSHNYYVYLAGYKAALLAAHRPKPRKRSAR